MFLVFGWMCSIVLVSYYLSNRCLSQLSITRRAPMVTHAEQGTGLHLTVTNNKKKRASYALTITDPSCHPEHVGKIAILGPQTSKTLRYQHVFVARGNHISSKIRIATVYPFGLFERSLWIETPSHTIVTPALFHQNEKILLGNAIGQTLSSVSSSSGEFYGLREFRTGDDPKKIHWRSYAKTGVPVLREFEQESAQEIVVATDFRRCQNEWQQEQVICLAASLIQALSVRGYRFGLATPTAFFPPQLGTLWQQRLWRHLALLTASRQCATVAPRWQALFACTAVPKQLPNNSHSKWVTTSELPE